MRGLTRAVAARALQTPWALIAGNVAVLAIATVVAVGAPADLGIGSTRVDDSEAASLIVVLESAEGVDSRVFDVARDVVAAQVEADPAVAEVEVQPSERRTEAAVLVIDMRDASSAEGEDALERLERRIDPGPLRVSLGGETAVAVEARRDLGGDLWRLELLVLPFVFLVVALTVGLRLAPAALLSAVTAIVTTLAIMRALGLLADVSLLGVAPAFVISVVLGVEIPVLLIRRYRGESSLTPPAEAVKTTLETSGGLIAITCGLAAVPAFGLLVTGLDQAPSLILGCALAAIFAGASALVSTAGLLALHPPLRARAEQPPAVVAAAPEPRRVTTALRSLPRWLAKSRLRAAGSLLLAVAVIVVATAPILDGVSRALVATDLGLDSEAARAARLGSVALSAGGSLLDDLPLAAAIAAGLVAIVGLVIARRPTYGLAGLLTPLPAAAGIGASVFVFGEGSLADLLDADTTDALHTGAVACAAAAVAGVTASRTAQALVALDDERRRGTIPVRAADQVATLLMPGVAAATLVGGLVAGALVGADLDAAKQFGLACTVGLLADLILRVPLVAVLARF